MSITYLNTGYCPPKESPHQGKSAYTPPSQKLQGIMGQYRPSPQSNHRYNEIAAQLEMYERAVIFARTMLGQSYHATDNNGSSLESKVDHVIKHEDGSISAHTDN